MVLPNVRKGNTIQVNLPIFQPRPQGFSLKKWVREKPWGRGCPFSHFFMEFFSIVKFSCRELGTENEQQ